MGAVHLKTRVVLNDLIKINNERVEGYTRARNESSDNATNGGSIFEKMIEQSRNYITDLTRVFAKYGGAVADGTIAMGKVYKTWMDMQVSFSAQERNNILHACAYCEDAAQRAYKVALEEHELGEEARSLIAMQKNSLLDSYDLIKSYRDRKNVRV
jgi:uncharacterized protein (TIGR02284 family)